LSTVIRVLTIQISPAEARDKKVPTNSSCTFLSKSITTSYTTSNGPTVYLTSSYHIHAVREKTCVV